MTKRRACTHQQPNRAAVSLTPRDEDVLRALARYPYLRAPYLHAFAGGRSTKRFTERLGLLFHEGYVDRPREQWPLPDARRRPALYETGKRMLGTEEHADARTFLCPGAHKQLEHSAMVCAVLASFEIACRNVGTVRFIPWKEIIARAPEAVRADPQPYRLRGAGVEVVVPDGIFGLEYQEGETRSYRFFALEADRGTMPISRAGGGQTSLMEKFRRYEALVSSGMPRRWLGVSSLVVLTVTTSDTRAGELARRVGDALREPGRFLCIAISERALDAPQTGLLTASWTRANFPPLSLLSGTSIRPTPGA